MTSSGSLPTPIPQPQPSPQPSPTTITVPLPTHPPSHPPLEHHESPPEPSDLSSSASDSEREASELHSLPQPALAHTDRPTSSGSTGARRRRGGYDVAQGCVQESPFLTGMSDCTTATDVTGQEVLQGTGRRGSRRYQLRRQEPRWYDSIKRWWARNIVVSVPHTDSRDHLALERTFLGYLRTSVAFSMAGVTISQLFRLQHALTPNPVFGYYVVGKPMSALFIVAALGTAILGGWRCYRLQEAMVRGKALAGGWEVKVIMLGTILLTTALFVLLLAVDIEKES